MWLNFAFESQQQLVCDEVVRSLGGKFLTPDLSALGYVICPTSRAITEIELPPCSTVSSLLQQICGINLHQLQILSIRETLNDYGMKALSDVLKSCTSLKRSYLKFSEISPSGAEYVTDGFKCLTYLQELTLSFTSTTYGIMALLSGLRHLTNTELILGFRTQENNAVLELASGLLALRNTNLYDFEL